MKVKYYSALFVFYLITANTVQAQEMEIKTVKIWDSAAHNAFTDLIRYKGKFYCTFREAPGHVPRKTGEDGKIRVLISEDGNKWESLALLDKQGFDLRDPKLSITPGNKLMLLFGGSVYKDGELLRCQTHVSFLENSGNNFSRPKPVVIDKSIRTDFDWLWRVTWFKGVGYGVIYIKDTARGATVFLVSTKNGIHYSLVSGLTIEGFPNEATVHFQPDGEMIILVRRDDGDKNGYMAITQPPYREWEWTDMGLRLGGPNLIPVDNATFIMGTRIYKPEGNRTALFFTTKKGQPEQFLELPSGGDNSYPGMLLMNNILWVSYYSSHEGKASIYLTKVPLNMFMAP